MKLLTNLSSFVKCIFISILLLSNNVCTYAQLKKIAKIEKIKFFTNGSVVLNKTIIDGNEAYSVTLPNNSKYHKPIVLFLGNKKEMMKNLSDLSEALDVGEKGEVFDFSACGKDYQLSFGRILGLKCFKVWESMNISSDFGSFFKATIEDILEFYLEEDKKQQE